MCRAASVDALQAFCYNRLHVYSGNNAVRIEGYTTVIGAAARNSPCLPAAVTPRNPPPIQFRSASTCDSLSVAAASPLLSAPVLLDRKHAAAFAPGVRKEGDR